MMPLLLLDYNKVADHWNYLDELYKSLDDSDFRQKYATGVILSMMTTEPTELSGIYICVLNKFETGEQMRLVESMLKELNIPYKKVK